MDVSDTRDAWLHFCSANGTPVPESNPVMMTITATIYSVIRACYEFPRIFNSY